MGTVANHDDGTWSWSWLTSDGPDDSQTVAIAVDDGNGGITEATFELVVTNVAPGVTLSPETVDVQYSDAIPAVAITATDVEDDPLTATATLPADAGTLAGGLTLDESGAADTGSWTLSGIADLAPGTHPVTVTVADDDGDSTTVTTTVNVAAEDAEVAFDDQNPAAVQVTEHGGTSGMFTLGVSVFEPDDAAPGDIDRATLTTTLVPVGPGSPIDAECTMGTPGTGDWTCAFNDVPVNTYTVEANVSGFYTGLGDGVLVVFDPSLGFTTGRGTYTDPVSGDHVVFAYKLVYERNHPTVKGSLVVIRQTDDGVYRLISNQLDGLTLGSDTGFSWASFTGIATYREPGWDEAVSNYEFVAYVEDWATPGADADRFWITAAHNSTPAGGLSLDNAEYLTSGNIVVRHRWRGAG